LAGARGDLRAALANPGRFAIEEKFDGFRGLLRLLDGTVTLLNRDGVDKGAKTGNAPTLVAAATAWANADKARWNGTLLDGEVFGGSWSNTAHLLGGAGRTTAGLRYIVFDVPYLAGRDLRSLSWTERRAILVKELASAPAPFEVSVILPPTASVVDDIWARGGEGVIIKDRTADYRSGDRTTWTKIKEEIEFDAVITGFDPGVGKYSQTTGAVRVSQFRGGVLTHVTSVSGMTDDVRHSLNESVIGRVVECRAQAKTADSYRHPRWFRLRPDKKPADCRWEDS
jgi:bifunctional non-homologous end joining protein LigD